MKNKRKNIIVGIIIFIVSIILILWINGVIPKQIAKVYSNYYLKKNFPKIKLEYTDIEWSPTYGDYNIRFKDENNKTYGFIISPKYFPIHLGQGMNELQEVYREQYEE